jgi:hypothetical protein
MKKNIFVLSTLMLISGNMFAQTEQEPSLFPELDFGVIQAEVDSDEVSETEAESILEEQQDIQEVLTDDVLGQGTEEAVVQEDAVQVDIESAPIEPDEELVEDEETDEEKEKLIYLALNNIKNYSATIKAVSYCSGYFVLFNDTKKVIQEISGTIGIGDQTKDFKFENVQSGESFGWPLQIVGGACDSMLQIPNIQVNVCKMERLSEKKCKEKLLFVPIGTSQ